MRNGKVGVKEAFKHAHTGVLKVDQGERLEGAVFLLEGMDRWLTDIQHSC